MRNHVIDELNFSYSVQLGGDASRPRSSPSPAAPQESQRGELYAIAHCDRLKLHNGDTLLINRETGTRFPVSELYSYALWNCAHFKTLDEHVQFLTTQVPPLAEDPSQVRRLLQQLVNEGLLISGADARARFYAGESAPVTLAPTRVCIITCDRPAAVERLLETMLRNASLSLHEKLFLVDDSRDSGNAAHNEELVYKFNLSSPVAMHYIGGQQQAELLGRIIELEPEAEEGLRFLADRERWRHQKSYGLARTLCLMLTVGRRCIVLDDDIICAAFRTNATLGGVDLTRAGPVTQFFTDAPQWRSEATATEQDLLAEHARCLGMDLGSALQPLGMVQMGEEELAGASVELLGGLTNAASPILLTQCGTLGDPGTDSNDWVTNLDPDSVERMLAAPGGLSSALSNRQCWVGFTRNAILKWGTLSQATGLDNSALLPPYFPVFRGEDMNFASLVGALHPSSVVLEYDWAVPHMPLEHRQGNPLGDSLVHAGGIGVFLSHLMDNLPLDPGVSPLTRLATLSANLLELSQLSDQYLLTHYQNEMARRLTANLANIDSQLRRTGDLSPQWKEFLIRHYQESLQALQKPSDPLTIPGLPAGIDRHGVGDLVRRGALEFASALKAWPAIRKAAAVAGEEIFQVG